MKVLMGWIVGHRRVSVLLTMVLTALFAIGLPRLQIDSSANMLLVPGDPDRAYYEQVRGTFGDEVILSIVINADDIFRPEILQAVENLSAEAEELDGVSRVVSLATVNNIRGQDGVLNVDKLVPYVPTGEEAEELAQIRDNALHNEILHGEVISKDGRTTAVNLFVADRPGDNHFNERITEAVAEMIDRELRALGPGAGVEIYQAGVPRLKVDVVRSLRRDLMTLVPLSFLVIFVVLFVLYRSLSAVVIPALTGALSVVMTMGFMGFAGLELTPVSLIIPLLLIVIGSTEDIHLISEFRLALAEGNGKEASIRLMAEKGGLAVFLTSLTTIFGFATIITNEIPILAEFGLASTFGMLANFVVTILLLPHLLRIFPAPAARGPSSDELSEKERAKGSADLFTRAAEGIAHIVSRRRRAVLVVSSLVVVLSLLSSRRVVINTDYLSFFRKDAPVRQTFDDIGERLAGAQSFYVVVETGTEGGLKDADNFRHLAALTDFVASKVDKVSGFAGLIRKTHREMSEGEEGSGGRGGTAIPDAPGLIAQYALMLDQDDLARFVDSDYATTSLLARTKVSGSREIRALIPEIQRFARENLPPQLKVKVTGEMILIAKASDHIGKSVVSNLLMLLGAVLAVISLLFWSLKAGLLAMIPNVIPVLINFAAMGLLGFELSPGTFSVAMIAFGIAVDDSIHFMVRYQNELKRGCSEDTAICESLKTEFRPILASSLALILGLFVLAFSNFGSVHQFGLLVVLSLAAALLCDLFLTPVIFLVSPLITAWDYLRLKIDEQSLRGSKLFRGLRLPQIKRVALAGRIESFRSGENVVVEGESGTDLFFVLSGGAKVFTRAGDAGGEKELEELGRGSFFGEMALVTQEPRSATVRAVEPLEVIRIGEDTLERLRRRHPRIAARIFHNIARLLSARLRRATRFE